MSVCLFVCIHESTQSINVCVYVCGCNSLQLVRGGSLCVCMRVCGRFDEASALFVSLSIQKESH